jgi:hypothetical protein
MRLHLFTCFGFAALALVPACEGGQTGDLSGQNGGPGLETGGGNCDEHQAKLAGFDSMTEQGTAEEVMAYAEKSFEAPLRWKAAKDGQSWSVAPESGTGVIHLGITRGANAYALTYTPREQEGSGPALGIGTICPPPQLGVEAHVEVTTDGGALAESYDTLLRTSTAGVSTLSLPLDLAKLSGDLTVSYSKPGAKLVQTSLEATLTAQGMTGTISGMEQIDSGSGPDSVSTAMGALLAVWPGSEACAVYQDGQGLSVPLEQEALGATGAATLASVTPQGPVDIEWLDATASKLTVSIASTGDACFAVLSDVPLELDGGPRLSYPVTITLKSDDGRVDGSYAGQVVVTGAGQQRRVKASATLALAVTEVDKSGFSSVQVPSSSDGLIVEVDSKLIGGVASGSVSLFATANAPCASEPQPMSDSSGASAPGCVGGSETRLENAYWTN